MTINSKLLAIGAALALSGASLSAQATVTPPGPGPLRPYVFPKIEQFTLPNGMNVVLVEKHTLPIISTRIILDAGALRVPAAKGGVANLTATLLSEGTRDLSGSEIARKMDALGAQFGTAGAFSAAFVDLTALKTVYPEAMAIAAKTIMEPAFPDGEFNRAKSEAIAGVQQSHARVEGLASDAFYKFAFDSTAPFSRPTLGTVATLTGITRDDVLNWAKMMYAPSRTTVLMVGDVDAAGARSILQSAFGNWKVSAPALPPVVNPASPAKGTRVIIIDRPASVQSAIAIGRAGFLATDPDYLTLLALNQVLGGGLTSRINLNLREVHAYTYGAFSALETRRAGGAIHINSSVRTNATDSAILEAVKEYRRITTEPVPQAELVSFTNNLVSSFPNTVQTVQGLQGRLQNLILWGLPPDYYKTYREQLAAVTPAQVQAAASRLDPNDLLIVVAGDASKIEAPIRALILGTVEVYDANGNKLR
jgi:predicted Zn-dependent peptidase